MTKARQMQLLLICRAIYGNCFRLPEANKRLVRAISATHQPPLFVARRKEGAPSVGSFFNR